MSQLEVDKVIPQSGTTLTLGESGDTVSVPSGATFDASNATLTLPDDSVTTAKIDDGAVTSAKITYPLTTFSSTGIDDDGTSTAITINSDNNVALAGNIGLGGATPTTSGTGITFPATASASTNANTLDDYEEGTWTPALTFGGNAVGLTYTTQQGKYTKIGNAITVQYTIFLSNKGSSSGNNLISGLPFTLPSASGERISAYQFADRITPNQVLTSENSTNFILQTLSSGTGSSAASLTNTDFVNNTYISGVFTYTI
jgi:hypothetical protein